MLGAESPAVLYYGRKIISMKNPNYSIRSRPSELPGFSTVSQTTATPRTQFSFLPFVTSDLFRFDMNSDKYNKYWRDVDAFTRWSVILHKERKIDK
jgi:hypothetical protein